MSATLIGCIEMNNEEPAGIEDLRKAKAELIRADTQVKLAEAELKKANVEMELVLIDGAKLANENTAIANKLAQLNLDLATAIGEAAKKEIANNILIAENTMELAIEAHKAAMHNAKETTAKAELAYEEALELIEGQKLGLSTAQKAMIDPIVAKITANRVAYNTTFDKIIYDEQEVLDAIAYDYANNMSTADAKLKIESNIYNAKATLIVEKAENKKYQAQIAALHPTIDQAEIEYLLMQIAYNNYDIAELEINLVGYDLMLARIADGLDSDKVLIDGYKLILERSKARLVEIGVEFDELVAEKDKLMNIFINTNA